MTKIPRYNGERCHFIYSSGLPPILLERKSEIIFANFLSLGWSIADKKQVVKFANDLPNLKYFCTDLNSKVLEKLGFLKIPTQSKSFKNQSLQYNTNSRKVYIHIFEVSNQLVSRVLNFPTKTNEIIENERLMLDLQKRKSKKVDAYIPCENISSTKSKSKSKSKNSLPVPVMNSFSDEDLKLFANWNLKRLEIPKELSTFQEQLSFVKRNKKNWMRENQKQNNMWSLMKIYNCSQNGIKNS